MNSHKSEVVRRRKCQCLCVGRGSVRGTGVEEEEVSWWSVILDGDNVDGRQILEWMDHSVRDFLSF